MPIVESFPDGLLEIVHEYANPPADPTSVHKINARVMLFLKEKKEGSLSTSKNFCSGKQFKIREKKYIQN